MGKATLAPSISLDRQVCDTTRLVGYAVAALVLVADRDTLFPKVCALLRQANSVFDGIPIVQATCNIAPFRKIPITALMDSAEMPKYKIVQRYCLYIIGTDTLSGGALSRGALSGSALSGGVLSGGALSDRMHKRIGCTFTRDAHRGSTHVRSLTRATHSHGMNSYDIGAYSF